MKVALAVFGAMTAAIQILTLLDDAHVAQCVIANHWISHAFHASAALVGVFFLRRGIHE